MTLTLITLTLLLAAANGANDISKGVSTLVGAGMASARSAVAWGVLWTALGAVVSAFAAQGLVKTFSGKGILAFETSSLPFFVAIAIGAVAWLVVATATGLPVSTTHALVGALVGSAVAHGGAGGVLWNAAAMKIAIPLLVSPIIAILLVALVFPIAAKPFARVNRYCVCVEQTVVATPQACGAMAIAADAGAQVVVAGMDCSPSIARVNALDSLHWLSSGATSFFRGMNDTPKIIGVGIAGTVAAGFSTRSLFLLVTVAMALGGLVGGYRVIRTLSQRVTPIEPDSGFTANAVTSLLVALASRSGLPVSTTHVSTGAIVGIGAAKRGRGIEWRAVGGIALAWLVTLPTSALFAAVASSLIS